MRYEVEVKSPFQWQCLVGDAVTLADGTLAEYTGANGHPNTYAMQCFVAVTGKVSRPIPLPPADEKAPLGYRFATEEDRKGPKPSWYMTWTSRWATCWLSGSNDMGPWFKQLVYAIPITPAETETEAREIPAIGVECDVVGVSSGSITLSPVPDFRRGDRVRVVRVQEEVKKG